MNKLLRLGYCYLWLFLFTHLTVERCPSLFIYLFMSMADGDARSLRNTLVENTGLQNVQEASDRRESRAGNGSALGILTVQATRRTLIHRPSHLEAARLPQRPCLRRPKLKASGRGGGEARGGGSRRRRRPWLKDRFRARSGPARLRYIVVWAGRYSAAIHKDVAYSLLLYSAHAP